MKNLMEHDVKKISKKITWDDRETEMWWIVKKKTRKSCWFWNLYLFFIRHNKFQTWRLKSNATIYKSSRMTLESLTMRCGTHNRAINKSFLKTFPNNRYTRKLLWKGDVNFCLVNCKCGWRRKRFTYKILGYDLCLSHKRLTNLLIQHLLDFKYSENVYLHLLVVSNFFILLVISWRRCRL